jgi:glutaconate CoA-transferase subunit A
MESAVKTIRDGDQVYLGGFGFNQPFSASHELIRQGTSDLNIVRTSGGIMLDQLIGAGSVSEAVIAHCWNAIGPTPTHAFRRAVEDGIPHPITIHEYGLGDLVLRLFAGGRHLPFVPSSPVRGTGQGEYGSKDEVEEVIFDGERYPVVLPLNPDVGIIHVHQADNLGNAQVNGPQAELRYGAMASDQLVVVAEEVVDEETIRNSPDRTLIPGFMVDDIVESTGGSHPSGVLGRYPRDIGYFQDYGEKTATLEGFHSYIDKWVHGVNNRAEYLDYLKKEGFGVEIQ